MTLRSWPLALPLALAGCAGKDPRFTEETPGADCVGNSGESYPIADVDAVSVEPASGLRVELSATELFLECEEEGEYEVTFGAGRSFTFTCFLDCSTNCQYVEEFIDENAEDPDAWTIQVLPLANLAVASDGASEATAQGETDLQCLAFGDSLTIYECSGFTACAPGATNFGGDMLSVAVGLAGDVPEYHEVYAYQYGFVFETDDDATNDWTGIPAYPNDTFKGTNLWVQYTAPIDGPWSVGVDDVSSSQQVVRRSSSEARVTRQGSVLVMSIPRADLGSSPELRVTTFRHDGNWLQGDWNIDYYPDTTTLLEIPPP